MFIFGLIILSFSIVFLMILGHGNPLNLLVPGTLFIIVLSNIAILSMTKSFKHFAGGLEIAMNYKSESQDLRKILRTYKMLFKATIATGFIGTLIGAISTVGIFDRGISEIGMSLAHALTGIVHSLILAYFVYLPIIYKTEEKLED